MKKKILFMLIIFTSLFLFACSYKEQKIEYKGPPVKKYMKTFDKNGTLLIDLSGYDINFKNYQLKFQSHYCFNNQINLLLKQSQTLDCR